MLHIMFTNLGGGGDNGIINDQAAQPGTTVQGSVSKQMTLLDTLEKTMGNFSSCIFGTKTWCF